MLQSLIFIKINTSYLNLVLREEQVGCLDLIRFKFKLRSKPGVERGGGGSQVDRGDCLPFIPIDLREREIHNVVATYTMYTTYPHFSHLIQVSSVLIEYSFD